MQLGTFMFRFMGGSMGSVVGEKITRMFERGVAHKQPVILLSSSGGARMQEGVLSLMQMGKTVSALGRLRDVNAAVHQRLPQSHHGRRRGQLRAAR